MDMPENYDPSFMTRVKGSQYLMNLDNGRTFYMDIDTLMAEKFGIDN